MTSTQHIVLSIGGISVVSPSSWRIPFSKTMNALVMTLNLLIRLGTRRYRYLLTNNFEYFVLHSSSHSSWGTSTLQRLTLFLCFWDWLATPPIDVALKYVICVVSHNFYIGAQS